jgi:hypothetical protein
MTDADALAILEDAHRRCGTDDMRTAAVFEALHWLEAQAELLTRARHMHPETWPFDQFRHALGDPGTPFTLDGAGRGQILNASINGIYRVCQIRTPRP